MKEFFCDDIWSDVWYEIPATPKKSSWEIFREQQRKTIASKEVGENVLPEKREQKLENDSGEKDH